MGRSCEICLTRKKAEKMFRIGKGCSHVFCSRCVKKHVKTQVLDNVTTIKCPGLGCEVVLPFESCRQILSGKVVRKWERALCLAAIPESEKYYCPFKDCSALVFKDDNFRECECPHCHRLFCGKCSVPWHVDMSCKQFRSQKEDVQLWKLARKKKWRACPKCKFLVERTQGCPHITCRCKFEFCYGCGSEWNGDHGGCGR